jgi:protein-arginine kinase activator protein McsA
LGFMFFLLNKIEYNKDPKVRTPTSIPATSESVETYLTCHECAKTFHKISCYNGLCPDCNKYIS